MRRLESEKLRGFECSAAELAFLGVTEYPCKRVLVETATEKAVAEWTPEGVRIDGDVKGVKYTLEIANGVSLDIENPEKEPFVAHAIEWAIRRGAHLSNRLERWAREESGSFRSLCEPRKATETELLAIYQELGGVC